MSQFQLPLICPKCRSLQGDVLISTELDPHPVGYSCKSCNATYPVVDGTPIILRDLNAWLRKELITVVARNDIAQPVWSRLLEAETPLQRDHQRLGMYANSPRGPYQDWLEAKIASLQGVCVDLGCGMADHQRDDILGVDLDWTLLQKYRGPRLLTDSLDPPFSAESFDGIMLLNVLDSCREPITLLQKVHALLRPGGRLVLSCSFSYAGAEVPQDRQIGEDFLEEFLRELGYRCDAENHDWTFRYNPRTTVIRSCLALDCFKQA